MVERVGVSDADLRRLLDLVDPARAGAAGEELPDSFLHDVTGVLGCDFATFQVSDRAARTATSQAVEIIDMEPDNDPEFAALAWRAHDEAFSYQERSGDHVSVTRSLDRLPGVARGPAFQEYADACNGDRGRWVAALVPLPPDGGNERRLLLWRNGSDFTDREVLLLSLLRPHLLVLHQRHWMARQQTPRLTPRQWEVLRLVADGRSNTQIAHALVLSEGTVRKHLENAYAMLEVNSRAEAIACARPWLDESTADTVRSGLRSPPARRPGHG